jgi:hypothetical protein
MFEYPDVTIEGLGRKQVTMTGLEQLGLKPEVVREMTLQCIHSAEDLLALAAQPNEREALLDDMKWTDGGLEAVLDEARRAVARSARAARA